MIISDLSYLEVVSEAPSIVGGNCSISVSIVNGKRIIKTSGCKGVRKEIIVKKLNSGSTIFSTSVSIKGFKVRGKAVTTSTTR